MYTSYKVFAIISDHIVKIGAQGTILLGAVHGFFSSPVLLMAVGFSHSTRFSLETVNLKPKPFLTGSVYRIIKQHGILALTSEKEAFPCT